MFPNEKDSPSAYVMKWLVWILVVGAALVVIANLLGFINLAFLPTLYRMENEARKESTTYIEGTEEELSRYQGDFVYEQSLIDADPNGSQVASYKATQKSKLMSMYKVFSQYQGMDSVPPVLASYVQFYRDHAAEFKLPTK